MTIRRSTGCAFSDAVVAIAITLIVLPLVDRAMEAGDVGTYLNDNSRSLASATVSFGIVSIFWRGHHRLFAPATGYTHGVIRLEFLWLATIAFLPVATALEFASVGRDSPAVSLYIGALLVASIALRGQRFLLERADLIPDPGPVSLLDRWFGSALLALALLGALLVPSGGPLWLLVLLIEPMARRLFGR